MAVRAEGSKKADCLILEVDYSRDRPNDWTKQVLRYARIRSRKLVVLARGGSASVFLADLRALSADNMDFPVRMYNDISVEEAAAMEKCSTYEVRSLGDIINLVAGR
ncbi:hypothetical protein TUZN_1860 [Thermoproteus uzoniensis 768-20]|uniref:Uncharacterized protein n=1 Tax=Thermoproteus uzoniensis (strain 768-20) TaxID=999630 RepID=F2L408_THEU7|nr:hypothetical protein [Thermoproteus uzoniensis]AEA13320.1 hypothetical protein TUZN_1860 [Thermoproteus uzoniensis 768-20]